MKTEGDCVVEKTLNMSITEASEEKEQQKTAEGQQTINSFPSHFYFKPDTQNKTKCYVLLVTDL